MDNEYNEYNEEQEQEYEESHHDSDAESWYSNESVKELDQTEQKNHLLDQKYKLVILFNENSLDIDEFNRQIKNINQSMDDLEFYNEYYTNELLDKESYFISSLETYINRIKKERQPKILTENEMSSLDKLYNEIKKLRVQDIKEEIYDTEPLKSKSLDERFEELFKTEKKFLIKVAKEMYKKGLTTQLIKEPDISSFPQTNEGINDYYNAYDEYIRKISKFITPIKYVEHMNITSIGSTYDKYQQTLKEKLIELKKIQEQLPIIVPIIDKAYFQKRYVLKNIMMKMEMNGLIDCAINTQTYHAFENIPNIHDKKCTLDPTMIERIKKYNTLQIKNNKMKITKEIRQNFVRILRKQYNSIFMDMLELQIYNLSDNNSNVYINKINDILFILEKYPNFKNLIQTGKITIYQLALFEKEITFEALIGTTNITKRRSTLRVLKSALLKNTLYSGLINNYKSNIFSKKLELLIYDISKTNKIYNYYSEKLIQYIKENPNRVFKEPKEKILLFLQLHFRKQKIKFDFSKLNINSVLALISQEKIIINDLQELKLKNKGILKQLNTKIKFSNKKLKYLEKQLVVLRKKEEEFEFVIPSEPIQIKKETNIKLFESKSELINEAVQAIKRKLMIQSLNAPEQNEKNNFLIHLFELLDINDALYKNTVVQNKLAANIVQLLPDKYVFTDFNNYYYQIANQMINSFITNGMIKHSDDLLDYYGNSVLDTLYKSKEPVDFYKKTIQNKYYKMIDESKIKKEPVYRKLQILYNPYTGSFGDQTGYLFSVEKLQSQGNGQPVLEEEPFTQIDPRTGQIKYSKHNVPIPGRDSFIKVPILTNKKDVYQYEYIKIPPGKVAHMYKLDHDSCNRFTNERDCTSGRGLTNSKCYYIKGICKAEYTLNQKDKEDKQQKKLNYFGKKLNYFGKKLNYFGKKSIILKKDTSGIKYAFNLPQIQRQRALIKRILFEKKKTGKKEHEAAIAVKRRLVLLRTFRKNKPQFKKQINILNKDINFINNKYLVK